jgi:hypothetical protein
VNEAQPREFGMESKPARVYTMCLVVVILDAPLPTQFFHKLKLKVA